MGLKIKGTVVLLFVVCLGCVTTRPEKRSAGVVGDIIRSEPAAVWTSSPPPTNETTSLEVWGDRLKVSKFDIPVTVNPAVEYWISYFLGKGRKWFVKYVERGQYFIPEITKILRAHQFPQDLVFLAMVESGFNNSAKSRARAVGPWQFIRSTGLLYGLTIDYWIDERRDTTKSTLAAIRYLKKLYQDFGSWELAAAAYNAGENKVQRAITKYRTKDFWELARHRFFKRETRDYVPKVMAAAIISKNLEQFGFTDNGATSIALAAAASESNGNGSEIAPKELGEEGASAEDTAEDSADEKELVAELEEENEIEGSEGEVEPAVALSHTNQSASPSMYMVANPNEQIIEFVLKGPVDLFAVARAAGLAFSTIKMLNPELLRWCTPPYLKTYRIKLPLSAKERFLATYNAEDFDRKVVFMKYTVKNGDNLKKVARRFGVEIDPIRELNNFAKPLAGLAAGSILTLPVPTGYKRVIASMYDEKPMPPRRKKWRKRKRQKLHQERAQNNGAQHFRLRPNLSRSTSEENVN